jgi:RHS repeat-associated protein
MTSTSNVFSTIDYGYDAAGQPLYEGNTIAGSGGRVQTTYNRYADGAVSRIIYPNTLSVRHDYTARGQLAATGWSDSNNNWLIQFATYNYLADGKVNSEDYGNGMHTGFGYDGRGFVNQETISRNNQIYSQRTFNRDERDRITAFQKGSDNSANPMENGRGDRFRYDEEGQLVEAWYNAADPANSGDGATRYDNFSYDALGNRFGWDYVASRHQWMNFTRKDNGLNQYSGWWPYCFIHYDDDIGGTWGTPGAANGVLMQDGWITAGYNALNQPMLMTSAATGGNWMFFGYDPLGRCVKRWTGGLMPDGNVPPPGSNPATYFYYDGWGLIQEGPNASVISAAYILGNRIDEIVADFSMSNYQWLVHHSGARGHSTLLTDWGGNIVEQYEYDAFGHPYFYNGSNGWTGDVGSSGFGNRFLFTGREWLSDLKLYDYRNRMYQPELGRFLQPDPKEFGAGDYNLYRYCHNDPVNRTDPTGLGMWPPQYNPFIEEALKDELYHFLDDTREMLDNPSSFVGPGEIGMVESAGGRGPVGRILARFFPRLGSEHPLGRLASHPPGNFGIGSATRAKASALGHRWVGSGYRRASDGKTLISRDGLRQYRPPSFKPDLGKVQANFEERSVSKGPWEKNGHLDITN